VKGLRGYLSSLLLPLLPATRAMAVKRALLRFAGANVGPQVSICSSARFLVSGKLTIGPRSWIGHDVLITGGDADIIIGADVDVAPRVTIVTGTHAKGCGERAAGAGESHPITIGDGSWIGACATVLGGVTIGERAIVAAGALVREDVPAHGLVVGVPAKPIQGRPSKTGEIS